jgi:hypothetical protein
MNNTGSSISIMTEDAIKEKYLRANTLKLQLAKVVAVAMIITALFLSWYVLDPPVKFPAKTVYDEAEVLSDATIKAINQKNAALYELTGKRAQVFVVVEKEKSNYKDLKKQADKLFKSYEVSDEGILFVVAPPSNTDADSGNFIAEIGGAIGEFFDDLFGEGRQPYAYHKGRNLDYISDNIIENAFANGFMIDYNVGADNFNAAVLNTFNILAGYYEKYYKIDIPEVPPVPPAPPVPPLPEDSPIKSNTNIIATVFGIAFLFVIIFVILSSFTKKNNSGASRVYRKQIWFK